MCLLHTCFRVFIPLGIFWVNFQYIKLSMNSLTPRKSNQKIPSPNSRSGSCLLHLVFNDEEQGALQHPGMLLRDGLISQTELPFPISFAEGISTNKLIGIVTSSTFPSVKVQNHKSSPRPDLLTSQLLFHYYDKAPWTRQLTKENIHLGLQSYRVRAMMAEQRPGGRNNWQAHTFTWTGGREAHRGWNHSLETPKPIPGDTSPPGRPHLQIFPKQLYPLGPKGSNTLTYESSSYLNHYS